MKHVLFFILLFMTSMVNANNMLVQNVTTLGNDPVNKTIQVQFDISWDNSWRDEINYDAAWIFMKFKDASGIWQHVQLNQTGFVAGTGTANTVQVTADKVGSWLYRSGLGSGTFNANGMQLQWNYGLSGLTDVTGLEVRVFAVEMVYVPEGEFNCAKGFYNSPENNAVEKTFLAPGGNFPVVNSRLTPTLTYNDGTNISLRIKGDAGVDFNNDGIVENVNFPTGYHSFFCFKFELTEQQYADFLNTLTTSQVSTLGIAGSGISLVNGVYYTNNPNLACGNSNVSRFLSYADWSGLRPMSILEFNKVSYGPLLPVFAYLTWSNGGQGCVASHTLYPAWGSSGSGGHNYSNLINVGSFASSTANRISSGASYFGVLEMTGNAHEPVVRLNYTSLTKEDGDGVLSANGLFNLLSWSSVNMVTYIDMLRCTCSQGEYSTQKYGFRYVRSAE
jgi:hypothetical protein